MKLSRRLIPAIAMLMVSAVLMSTASFAWFSINSEVQATGMAITATADSSLVIKGDSDSSYSSVAKNVYGSSNEKDDAVQPNLKPCTSSDGVNFAHLTAGILVLDAADAQSSWGGDGFQSKDLTSVNANNFAQYVTKTTYSIKNIGADAEVYVSGITVTGKTATAGKLAPALRVAVKVGGDAVKVYKPDANANLLAEGVGAYDETNGWSLDPDYTYTAIGGDTPVIVGDLQADKAEDVIIYIWVEGQDDACMSDNVDTTAFQVVVNFASKKVETAVQPDA